MAKAKSTTKSNTKNTGAIDTMTNIKNSASLDEIYKANPHIPQNVIRILLENLETSNDMFPMPERNHAKKGITTAEVLLDGTSDYRKGGTDKNFMWTEDNCLFTGTNHPVHEYIQESCTQFDIDHNEINLTKATNKLLGIAKKTKEEKGKRLQGFHVCPCYWLTDETVKKLEKLNEPSTDTKTKGKKETKKEPVLATPPSTKTKPKAKGKKEESTDTDLATVQVEYKRLTDKLKELDFLDDDDEIITEVKTELSLLRNQIREYMKS